MSVLVKHDLEGYEFEKICINGKSLSEIQLEHEMEDEFKVVVVKMVHECRDCMIVVKEIVSRLLEEDEVSHFGKEKQQWMKKRLVEKEKRNWDEMIHHHFHQSWHQVEVMRKDDFE
uniref:Uncharacterized protein n=1 Tax=Tanacetum cinerariifolium TaxID=118510 RepID=A0A699I1L5_TANCI|nr:hypothetical protein [Tanacetum cinerariifolium]